MEIFQTIWTVLTTPNAELSNILIKFFIFIELTVVMLLFTTILNINTSKKRKIIYILTLSAFSCVFSILLPKYYVLINMFVAPLAVMFILNTSLLKSIVAEIIAFFSVIISESLLLRIYLFIFNISSEIANATPIYRILFALIIYTFIYILYRLAKFFNFNINHLDNMKKSSKILLGITFVLGIISIFIQNYLNAYYSDLLPLSITLLSTSTLVAFFIISMYSLTKTTQLSIVEQNLEESQLYNKSLKILHDNVRAFKHDFSNIVQAIGRLC